MSMLKHIPTSELASIVSGNSPNPVIDTPPTDLFTNMPHPHAHPSTPESNPTVPPISGGIPAYQHALQSMFKRRLSGKRKPSGDRRSLPTPETSSNTPEADKDVVEIHLDDGPRVPHSTRSEDMLNSQLSTMEKSETSSLQSPVYPALLLNAVENDIEPTADGEFLFLTSSCGATSVPEMPQLEEGDDYFGNAAELPSSHGRPKVPLVNNVLIFFW